MTTLNAIHVYRTLKINALKGKIDILEHTHKVKDHEEWIQVLEEKAKNF